MTIGAEEFGIPKARGSVRSLGSVPPQGAMRNCGTPTAFTNIIPTIPCPAIWST